MFYFFFFFAFCCLSLDPSQIRLTGGRTQLEGRVEILATNAGVLGKWGLICGDEWTSREAMVACRQLGLGHASSGLRVRRISRACVLYQMSLAQLPETYLP